MIKVKFKRDKKKYIAFIDANSKKQAIEKLKDYAGDCKIKSIKNSYCLENKIIIN